MVDQYIYIVTRLFDHAERLKSARLEDAVVRGIKHARSIAHLTVVPRTFLPFRDTNQTSLRVPNQAQYIYNADLKILENLFGLIGYFDGVSKDEGISMEIGYAFGKKKPIVLIITDFLVYRLKEHGDIRFLYDPVVERMTGHLIKMSGIPDSGTYVERLNSAIDMLHIEVEKTVVDLVLHPDSFTAPLPTSPIYKSIERVVLEFGGGNYEWQRLTARGLMEEINKIQGCKALITDRYTNPTNSARIAGERDILKLLESDILVVNSDSDEMNAGSAALIGLARALGKFVILFDSKKTISFCEDGQEMSRNLMVDCSADIIASAINEIPDIIRNHIISRKEP